MKEGLTMKDCVKMHGQCLLITLISYMYVDLMESKLEVGMCKAAGRRKCNG